MAARPNVLWLMCDQLSCSVLAPYDGWYHVETPSIERLAREGTVLNQCYTPSPVCVPARFAALTGIYPHRSGCVSNRTPLPLRFRTAAHEFSRRGYVTGSIGKLHPVDAQTHGFDVLVDFGHYFDYLGPQTGVFGKAMGATDAGCGVPWVDTYTGGKNPWKGAALAPGLPQVLQEEDHPDSFFAREAIRFLRQYGSGAGQEQAPFFLFVSFLRPHRPFAPPQRYAERYPPESITLPPPPVGYDPGKVPAQARHREIGGAFTPEGDALAREWVAGYCGNVAHVDDCVGQVLAALDELHLTEETLVIFMSDHGDMLYDHGLVAKFTFFDASCRVPCILCWPGHIDAGVHKTEIVDLTDLLPTSLEAVGATIPADLDGCSFWGAISGTGGQPKEYILSALALDTSRPMYMLRTGRWKYNRYVAGEAELYDMEEDPAELNNLAWDLARQALCQELSTRMDALIGAEAARCQQERQPLPWAAPLPR
ncbi:MAG: sulfatase-like hydrolase/transferase [Chloroflexi bacterium]|nr:sulfatase-like hydrolase/transferase [Chloroflexota bacterium]